MLGIGAELLKQARPVVMRLCLTPRVTLWDLLIVITSQFDLYVFIWMLFWFNHLDATQNVGTSPTLKSIRNLDSLGDCID